MTHPLPIGTTSGTFADPRFIVWKPYTVRIRTRDRATLLIAGTLSARLEKKLTLEAECIGEWLFVEVDEDTADALFGACERLGLRAHLESEVGA